MSLSLRASRLFRHALRETRVTPAARITHHPPQDPTGPVAQTIAIVCFFAAILGPSSWILAHLEDYKKRD